ALVKVTTRQGEFSFEPNLAIGETPRLFLNGRASVQAVPPSQRVTEDDAAEDYPSLIEARYGTLWLPYQSYDGRGDRSSTRQIRDGRSSKTEASAEAGGDYCRTAIAQDSQGRGWVVWSAQRDGNFDLWTRAFDGKAWSRAERLTTAPNSDIYHVMSSDAKG